MTKQLFKTLVTLGLGFIVSGCSSAFLASLNTATRLSGDFNQTADIAYGQEPWQQLDIYTPTQKSDQQRPVLVFFYGGGWTKGEKEQYLFVAEAFVRRGYVVVLPNYVKYPQGVFPQFIKDGAHALAWVEQHIENYGGDAKQVFIGGHSAGAHLAAMLATDQHYLQDAGVNSQLIRAMAGIAGPYNFTPKKATYRKIFVSPDNYPAIQVVNFIDGSEPPLWLAVGGKDTVVGKSNIDILLPALQKHGVSHQLVQYDDRSHISILLAMSRLLASEHPIIDDMDAFFRSTLETNTSNDDNL